MSDAAFTQFIAPENAWIHEAIQTVEQVFGVSNVDATLDENGKLTVTVTPDPATA